MLHAIKGNEWLDECLKSVNKTRSDLAKELWENEWTAVAELCDDSFEEHVLAYDPEETGLHLHGLNKNTRLLSTAVPDRVSKFAKEWGFIETKYLVMDTIEEVRSFTDACSEDDGQWNGKHVEGFVVRSHHILPDSPQAMSGDTFMFKVKFEQPYLRWREWRELTRKMLSHHNKKSADAADGTLMGVRVEKLKHPQTKAYARWTAERISTNPKAFDSWADNKGIVSTRDCFLEWYSKNKGSDKEEDRIEAKSTKAKEDCDRVLLIPIAVPGCGATSLRECDHGLGESRQDADGRCAHAPLWLCAHAVRRRGCQVDQEGLFSERHKPAQDGKGGHRR